MWTGNCQVDKIQTLNPTFAGAWDARRFYKIQIMETHLLHIGTNNLDQVHCQKSSQKEKVFVE